MTIAISTLIIVTIITKIDFSSILTLSVSIIRLVELFHSLKKQPTFHDATSGFPAKWRLRNERSNSILIPLVIG